MPRQRSSRPSAPARSSPAAAPAQTRSASTMAAPAPPTSLNQRSATTPTTGAQSSQQPGMLAQMAATAGSVAVGSTIGHGISSMLFGGSSSAQPVDQAQQVPVNQQQQQMGGGAKCEVQARDFTKCIEVADFQSCSYYLEQLKACQAAAAPY